MTTLPVAPERSFTQYEDALKQKGDNIFLGNLAWYQVSDMTIKHDRLEAALKASGLDFAVPRPPRDEDVFRRCAPNGHARRVSTTNAEIHVNYLIRQVKRSKGACTKHIVAETVDASGETLAYEEVYELKYDTKAKDLQRSPIGAGDYTAGDIAEEIARQFEATRGHVDDNAVRSIIRRVLDEARATSVRPSGGVYFVMTQYADLLASLEKAVGSLPGVVVHSLPLIDDAKQRDMLRQAYEAETIDEVDRSVAEISELLHSNDTITTDQYGRLSARFTALMSRNGEYVDLLQGSLDLADTKLDIYRKQMTQLLHKVA